MKSFDEWFKSEDPFLGNDGNMDCIWAKKFMKIAFSAGAASRQTEIDNLKQSYHGASIGHDVFIKQLKERHKAEIDELQKRINFLEVELKTSNDAIALKSTYKVTWEKGNQND